MAENVQETKPPEPPPKPPEVPKPTEQSNRSEAKDQRQPQESQQSAQQDARNAAQSEHARANAREPDGLRPTPEFQERLDQHTAAKNGPEELRPTPEFQAGLDQHTAAKAERNGAGQQDTPNAQQDEQASPSGERPPPPGEQASEHAAARESAAAEHAKASNPQYEPAETPRPRTAPQDAAPSQDAAGNPEPATSSSAAEATARQATDQDVQRQPVDEQAPAVEQGQQFDQDAQPRAAAEQGQAVADNPPTAPPDGYTGPERRQHDAQHLDPAGDLRSDPEILIQDDNAQSEANAPQETGTDVGERAELGAGSGPWFDEGTNHREGGAVQQMTDGSCVSASGEMLTDGRITQPELLSEIGDWSNLSALRDELNNRDGDGAWKGQYFATGAEAVERASEGPMAAQVQAPLGRGHMVMLEPGENGSFTVRDPYQGSSYDVDSNWVEKYVAGGVFR